MAEVPTLRRSVVRRVMGVIVLALAAMTAETAMPQQDTDPLIWLEDIEGERALAWVRARNERSLALLQSDPRYADLNRKALAILEARDRVPQPTFRAGQVFNFWQDEANARGILRRTGIDSYRSAVPAWETVLDIDALAAAEQANWVYQGGNCLAPAETRCLLSLSDGGKDAVEIREFDATSKTFVKDGFVLPAGKQSASWLDADTLYVARDWGPGTMTTSGYAFIVKSWQRGTRLEEAREVFRGQPSDVGASPSILRDSDGVVQAVLFVRNVSFFETEYYLATDAGPIRLPFPPKSSIKTIVSGRLVLTIEQDWSWQGVDYPQGALLSFDLAGLKRDAAGAAATLIHAPGPRESIEQIESTRNRLLVALYENVKGALYSFAWAGGKWSRARADLPGDSSIDIVSTRNVDDLAFLNVTNFLAPDALFLGDARTGAFAQVKALPPRFDASGLAVDQLEATSSDGVKIPYFVVRRKDLDSDGSNAALLYAYGGFQVSETPAYSGTLGKLWLERGGVYVLANIRGGGEFGPAWHQAGLKTKRQIVYDDFAAVGRDLVARKISSPRRLGIMGGSNGGLLMGVAMTQHPDLWNAVVVQVPLLDMLRYHTLLAGASWVDEYGDPSEPAEGRFLRTISPYHNLRSGVKYPEPLFVTSTKDDRVHPGHARKMAAKMESLGLPFLYYENIDGGHSAAANQAERARRTALEFTYLTRKLMD